MTGETVRLLHKREERVQKEKRGEERGSAGISCRTPGKEENRHTSEHAISSLRRVGACRPSMPFTIFTTRKERRKKLDQKGGGNNHFFPFTRAYPMGRRVRRTEIGRSERPHLKRA